VNPFFAQRNFSNGPWIRACSDELISRSFPHRYELISRNNDVFGERATRDGPSGASEGRRPTSPRLYAPQRAPHSQ